MTWYFAFNILTIDGFIFWRRPEGYRRPESLHSLISDLRRCCTLFVITNEFCHQRCILGKIMYWLFCVWLKCITLFPFKCFIFTEAFALLIFKILPYTLVMGLCHYLFFSLFFFFSITFSNWNWQWRKPFSQPYDHFILSHVTFFSSFLYTLPSNLSYFLSKFWFILYII